MASGPRQSASIRLAHVLGIITAMIAVYISWHRRAIAHSTRTPQSYLSVRRLAKISCRLSSNLSFDQVQGLDGGPMTSCPASLRADTGKGSNPLLIPRMVSFVSAEAAMLPIILCAQTLIKLLIFGVPSYITHYQGRLSMVSFSHH